LNSAEELDRVVDVFQHLTQHNDVESLREHGMSRVRVVEVEHVHVIDIPVARRSHNTLVDVDPYASASGTAQPVVEPQIVSPLCIQHFQVVAKSDVEYVLVPHRLRQVGQPIRDVRTPDIQSGRG